MTLWTPAEIATALWLDGADGLSAATWSDKSGNGRDATQPIVGSRPTIVANALNETSGPTVRLSALVTACGTAKITVTDGCSTVYGMIRCTAGQWQLVGERFRPYSLYLATQTDFYPWIVNGYTDYLPGRIVAGEYCLALNDPNTHSKETWAYTTWPRVGQFVSCTDHSGATIKDPIIGFFDIDVFSRPAEPVSSYLLCGGSRSPLVFVTVYRYRACDDSIGVWRWTC